MFLINKNPLTEIRVAQVLMLNIEVAYIAEDYFLLVPNSPMEMATAALRTNLGLRSTLCETTSLLIICKETKSKLPTNTDKK